MEGEADMETVSCAFSLLCLILYMSGWSEVENEQRSGCGERASGVMWRISVEDIYLRLAKKILSCVFVLY